ncbi:MAG: protein phosphatase 2C domain-containing protein [Candidatus Yanofskybacteria bacterium]|nr:protein phosphatase 2C domain-containing protein [Candidatus Yanofskybacteria bacterium]
MRQRFYVDDYFHIGQTHLGSGKPCQDYSFSGVHENGAFAIVSDGCSTGRHTDVGARIIALSTAHALGLWFKGKNIPLAQLRYLVKEQHDYAMLRSSEILDLQFKDLLATCIYACLAPDGGLVSIQGDGAIAKVYRDGSVVFIGYRWDDDMPLYPAYAADNYRGFIKAHGDDPNARPLKVEHYHYDLCGGVRVNLQSVSLDEAIRGVAQEILKEEVSELSFLVVFTDGVMQVEGMDWTDAVWQLLAFKNLNGEFAKRRMIKFIKDSKKDGRKGPPSAVGSTKSVFGETKSAEQSPPLVRRGPLDDISYAVIRIEHEILQEV